MVYCGTLSTSKYDTYKQCKFKFLKRYIERADPDEGTDTNALQFGSYIHKIFEDGSEAKSVQQLERIAEDLRPNYEFSDKKYSKKKIKKCLENFHDFISQFTKVQNIGDELKFKVDLFEGATLNGIIDKVLLSSEGYYLIIDYKTSKRELDKFGLYNSDQMKTYVYAIHKMFNIPISKIIVAHYYPLTNNFVTIKFTKSDINRFINEKTQHFWEIRKRKKENFHPEPNKFCDWCAYKKQCPEFK